jgi:uncharacterized protein YjbI with pentapeptide repeats
MTRRSKEALRPPQPPDVLDALLPLRPGDSEGSADWEGREVSGELTGYVGTGAEVSGSRFLDVRLTAAEFDGARFTDVKVIDSDLSGASFHRAALTRVAFLRCRMRGVVLAAARIRDVVFSECLLDEANLREIEGSSVRMEGCQLVGADFSRAKLRQTAIFDSDLTDAEFEGADVQGIRLHGSRLESVRGAGGLSGTVIEASQVLPLALPLVSAMRIEIDDDREPGILT